MSNETLMDPADFAHRLDRAFGHEPPHGEASADLTRGRRRLWRRRAGTSFGTLATVGVVGAVATLLPGSPVTQGGTEVPPATGGVAAAELTAVEVLERCTTGENAFYGDVGKERDEQRAIALLGDEPRLKTWSATGSRTMATLVSRDGRYWAECQFRNVPDNGMKNALSVFSTDVSFPRTTVGGVAAYEPVAESDQRLHGTSTPNVPQLEVTCPAGYDGLENSVEEARCPEFVMYWNDRRVPEVAAAKVVAPDGETSWAEVDDGYVSWTYTGAMTEQIARRVAQRDTPLPRRIVLYDAEGEVLVDDRSPGRLPQDGSVSIANFPSLAWWLM
jgi:hypothetical protein